MLLKSLCKHVPGKGKGYYRVCVNMFQGRARVT